MTKTRLFFTSLIAIALIIAGIGWQQVGAQDSAETTDEESAEDIPRIAPDAALGTGFTYQGQLNDGGSPANGNYDFRFTLYNAASGGSAVTLATTKTLPVVDGLFTAEDIDFGNLTFNGAAVWMQVEVRTAGIGGYTTLTPRQEILGVPYAIGLKPNARIYGEFDPYGLHIRDQATSGATRGLYVYSDNPNGISIYGNAGDAIGVQGRTTSINSTGVYAENTADFGLDLILGGSANTTRGDDGRIGSDPAYPGSDMMLMSNDGVFVYLDDNGDETGQFGIYDDADRLRLEFVESAELSIFDDAGTETVEIAASEGDTGGQIILRDDAGNATITLDAEFGNGGNGRITTEVVEITGGADLSEQFAVSGDVQPGMVVSIDPANPGQLTISTEPYDRKVAGIVSGAGGVQPGLLMGQAGSIADGDYPIALTGRVYVWADASNGAIEAGDLLTTADLDGFVMGVSDYDQAQGAIIGKAMESLESGQGLILVLVSLQ